MGAIATIPTLKAISQRLRKTQYALHARVVGVEMDASARTTATDMACATVRLAYVTTLKKMGSGPPPSPSLSTAPFATRTTLGQTTRRTSVANAPSLKCLDLEANPEELALGMVHAMKPRDVFATANFPMASTNVQHTMDTNRALFVRMDGGARKNQMELNTVVVATPLGGSAPDTEGAPNKVAFVNPLLKRGIMVRGLDLAMLA
jgi:hypothetical protein